MLYKATYYPYSDTTGHGVGETRTFGSLKAARMWAKSILPQYASVSDENYHRDMGRMPTVNILSTTFVPYVGYEGEMCRKPAVSVTVRPEISIVPSVGQLGYW